MSSISRSDLVPAAALPELEAFERAAAKGEALSIEIDGERLSVAAKGQLPESGRQITWVEGSSHAISPGCVFAQALASRFGNSISAHVERELKIDLSAHKPIAARTVEQAISMAQTASLALDGAAFAQRLNFSASSNSQEFIAAAKDAGVSPDSIDLPTRRQIDARFAELLAAAGGGQPTPDLARQCLQEALQSVLAAKA